MDTTNVNPPSPKNERDSATDFRIEYVSRKEILEIADKDIPNVDEFATDTETIEIQAAQERGQNIEDSAAIFTQDSAGLGINIASDDITVPKTFEELWGRMENIESGCFSDELFQLADHVEVEKDNVNSLDNLDQNDDILDKKVKDDVVEDNEKKDDEDHDLFALFTKKHEEDVLRGDELHQEILRLRANPILTEDQEILSSTSLSVPTLRKANKKLEEKPVAEKKAQMKICSANCAKK